MQLKNINRSIKRDITNEKFFILFYTKLKIENVDLELMLLSLPIVVIVHVNQEVNALATIVWDASFSNETRVSWNQFSKLISDIFEAECSRELTEGNLHFIAEKYYDQDLSFPFLDRDNLEVVNWNDFSKKKISGRDITFWEWFYSILKLTKEYLGNSWREGYIEGFISKRMIDQKLNDQPTGTFMLRFSDSVKG